MPLILPRHVEEKWLDPTLPDDELQMLMIPFPAEQMEAYEIDKTRFRNGITDPNRDRPVSDIIIDLDYVRKHS